MRGSSSESETMAPVVNPSPDRPYLPERLLAVSVPVPSRERVLATARHLCFVTAIVYPTFWATNRVQAAPYVDPLLPRVALTLATAAFGAATYFSEAVRSHLSTLLIGVVYAITGHI